MHRWQSDAADIPELERTHLQPELERFRALLREHTPAETDVDMALHNIAWCIRGFCTGGVIIGEGQREGSENPILLNRFRQHLYHLTDLLFKPR